jgi:hypothetical protein
MLIILGHYNIEKNFQWKPPRQLANFGHGLINGLRKTDSEP